MPVADSGTVSPASLHPPPQDSILTYVARGHWVLVEGSWGRRAGCTRASLVGPPVPGFQVSGCSAVWPGFYLGGACRCLGDAGTRRLTFKDC